MPVFLNQGKKERRFKLLCSYSDLCVNSKNFFLKLIGKKEKKNSKNRLAEIFPLKNPENLENIQKTNVEHKHTIFSFQVCESFFKITFVTNISLLFLSPLLESTLRSYPPEHC